MKMKYIIWNKGQWDETVKEDYEQEAPKGKLNLFNLFILLVFNKRFRWEFEDTIKYALIHADSLRGDLASSVYLLQCNKKFDKIWRKQNEI